MFLIAQSDSKVLRTKLVQLPAFIPSCQSMQKGTYSAVSCDCCTREQLHQHWKQHSRNICVAGRASMTRGFTCSPGLMPRALRLIFPSACRSVRHGKDGEADGAASGGASLSSTVPCRCALSGVQCLNCLGPCLP